MAMGRVDIKGFNAYNLPLIESSKNCMQAKPFLKWAGGKTQLIEQIQLQIPPEITNKPLTYIEPFVGSGAVLFWMINHVPYLEKIVINDVNQDLIACYQCIQNNVEELIAILKKWQHEYHLLSDKPEQKKVYFYQKRSLFNQRNSSPILQSALLIFLNRTCFNGLYRVNRKNAFNVPIGSYHQPQICHEDNLKKASKALQKVIILHGDYAKTLKYATANSLFYLDPPYKPLSTTASFNAYSQDGFDDQQQIRLAQFCEKLNNLNHHFILSNSDVRAHDPENHFFDDLYAQFKIIRVHARRNINANASKRGQLTELLIRN